MKIELTNKEAGYLKRYAEVYDSERNLDSTRTPIIVVENEVKISCDCEYAEGFQYIIDDDGEHQAFDDIASLFKYMRENMEDINYKALKEYLNRNSEIKIDGVRIFEWWYQTSYQPIAYFLTRASADAYVKYQRHNLIKPRVYSRYSGYGNNGDLPTIMEMLLRMGNKLMEIQHE